MKALLKLIGLVTLITPSAYGKSKSETNTYFRTDGAAAVQKSNTLEGTDFATMYSFRLGTQTGSEGDVGMAINWDQMDTKFTQANGSMASTWTDFRFSYRIKWFQPTLAIGHCEIKAKQSDPTSTEVVDASCITAGGGLDMKYDVSKTLIAHFDTLLMSPTSARDRTGKEVTIGPRTDLEAGVTFYLPVDGLGILTGYRLRTFSLDIDDSGPKLEMQTGPFLGFTYGLSL
jgi:hypothetical protein